MDDLEKLQNLAFNFVGVYLALNERARTVGWSRAIQGAFGGVLGCYIVAALLILSGQLLLQLAINRAPAPAAARPAPLIVPPKPGPAAIEKPQNLAPLVGAMLLVPFFWLLIKETFFPTLETANRPYDPLWNRLAPAIECDDKTLADRAVRLAFRSLQTVAIVIPVLVFAEKLVTWFR